MPGVGPCARGRLPAGERPSLPASPLAAPSVNAPSTRSLVPGAPRLLVAALAVAAVAPAADAQSLRGSRSSVERMHDQAVAQGLRFHETSTSVNTAVRRGDFTRLTGNADYTLKLVGFPYVTDETRLFVERLADQYHAACGERLVVTSAMRPTSRQPRNSVDLSVHPTGMAVDLRKPSNAKCLRYLRSTLVALEAEGVLEATEERRPPHFHVAVFPRQYARYTGGTSATRLASAAEATGTDTRAEERASLPALATIAAPTRSSSTTARRTSGTRASSVRRHKIRPGDTLWDLARRYDTTVKSIRAANRLSGSKLRPGQQLVIPKG